MFSFLYILNESGGYTLTFKQIKQLYREYIYWLKPDIWNIYKYFYKLIHYKIKIFK